MGIGKKLGDQAYSQDKKESDAKSTRFEAIEPQYALADLILPSETLSSILDFLAFKVHYDRIYDKWGLSETHKYDRQTSVNFHGPSGTGKTTAAHAVAREMQKELIFVNYSEIESKYVGETSKNLSALFDQAKNSGSIIFFDEADAILSKRVTDMSSSTDVSVNQTRSVLLTLMDQHKGMIIFATNFMGNYDPAFVRRIFSHIHFKLPDNNARRLLWEKFIPQKMPVNIDIDELVLISAGLSGAEISNCVIKSALSASRRERPIVDMDHFRRAVDEILLGKSENLRNPSIISSTSVENPVTENYVRENIGDMSVEELMK